MMKNPSHVNQNEIYEQKVDRDLFEWYKKLIKIRLENKTLVYGKFREVFKGQRQRHNCI